MRSAKVQNFIDGLITQDYILFGSVLLLFILLIILSILLRKHLKTAVVLILLAFCIITLGPTYGYVEMHNFLFKNEIELISQKKLSFVEAVVVKGKVTNRSKYNFKACTIKAAAYRVSGNELKNFVYKLKPLKIMSITTEAIDKNETEEFKIIIEPFRYAYDYNISLEADCR